MLANGMCNIFWWHIATRIANMLASGTVSTFVNVENTKPYIPWCCVLLVEINCSLASYFSTSSFVLLPSSVAALHLDFSRKDQYSTFWFLKSENETCFVYFKRRNLSKQKSVIGLMEGKVMHNFNKQIPQKLYAIIVLKYGDYPHRQHWAQASQQMNVRVAHNALFKFLSTLHIAIRPKSVYWLQAQT